VSNQNASIRLSTEHKGRRRREPVWIGRYRIVGKDSAKVLGRAWTKRSQAPDGYLIHSQAEAALRQLLAAEGAAVRAARGATFDEVAEVYVTSLRGRIKNGSFRSSTLRTYAIEDTPPHSPPEPGFRSNVSRRPTSLVPTQRAISARPVVSICGDRDISSRSAAPRVS
jgi:hypothetical protein